MAPVPATAALAPGAGAPGATPSKAAPSSGGSTGRSVRKVGKYQLGKTLGQGTFGKVKLAVDTETGRQVAIKMMDKAKIRANHMGEQIKKEISIMKLVRCEHVVQLIEVLASASTIFVVMELVAGGELFDKIIAQGCFTEEEARNYFGQLIAGIAECHERGVCHRDLKPENLLLDANGVLKISDFGLSAMATDTADDVLHTTCGTPNYVAPEVLLSQTGYDGKAADVWSSGIILYVLLAGFLPFDETSMVELFRKIVKADFAYPATLSPEAQALLHEILNPDPEKRATITEIKQSAWMRGITLQQWQEEKERDLQMQREKERLQAAAAAQHQQAAAAAVIAAAAASVPTADTPSESNEAITWLVDQSGARKPTSDGVGGALTASSTPSQGPADLSLSLDSGMRPLNLEVTRVNSNGLPVSTPATPLGSLLSSPRSNVLLAPSVSYSPNTSPLVTASSPGMPSAGLAALSLGPASGGVQSGSSSPSTAMHARRALRMPSSGDAGAGGAVDPSDPLSLDEEEMEMKGPVPLNAFDMINMVGGAAMGRMLQPRETRAAAAPAAAATAGPAGGSGSGDAQGRGDLRTFTQFTSSLSPDEIWSKLSAVLSSLGSECSFRIYPRPCVAKVSRSSGPRGKILGSCQLYQLTPKLRMLEWRKLKGDVFLFHDFFREVKRRFTGKNEDGTPWTPSANGDASGGGEDAYADGDATAAAPSGGVVGRGRGGSAMIPNKPR